MFRFASGGITSLPHDGNAVFLTFDDGPDSSITPSLLELLNQHDAKATFFVVGQKAQGQASLLKEALRSGHEFGDHSWDHRYLPFFQSQPSLKRWIDRSFNELGDILGRAPVGFRSPAGIVTPPLVLSLRELGIPLIHWNRRYFDTQFRLGSARAEKVGRRLLPGDIVLFHDGNARDPRALLDGIRIILRAGKQRGLKFIAIPARMVP